MIKQILEKIVYSNPLTYKSAKWVLRIVRKLQYAGKNSIINKGNGWIKKDIIGYDNEIRIGENSRLIGAEILIRGNNNIIDIGENCMIGPDCSFWMIGNDTRITIGSNCTFNNNIHFCAQENNAEIIIGMDCMFSNSIIIRTSDSHPIFETYNKKRINSPADIILGNHVWICPGVRIMKGSIIGDGTIIGSNSVVTKSVDKQSLVVGVPAKVVKNNVTWERSILT